MMEGYDRKGRLATWICIWLIEVVIHPAAEVVVVAPNLQAIGIGPDRINKQRNCQRGTQ